VPPRLTLAYARGALMQGVHIFTGRRCEQPVTSRTAYCWCRNGPGTNICRTCYTGCWSLDLPDGTQKPPCRLFSLSRADACLASSSWLSLRHTLSYYKLSYLVPKADGSIYVGATSERVGFSKTMNAAGIDHIATCRCGDCSEAVRRGL